MKIHLLFDKTALLVDDRKPTVTVEPATSGTLEIEGRCFKVEAKGTPAPVLDDLIGHVRVIFEDKRGVRYIGIRPHVKDKTVYSAVDFTSEYVKLRVHVDELERRVEKLTEGFHALAAESKHDALGFLTENTRKMEA